VTPSPTPDDHYRAEFRAAILSLAPGSIADIGCGAGALLGSLKDEVPVRIGIEPAAAARALATPHATAVHDAPAEALPLGDGAVDLAVMTFVPHHCRSWDQALSEALRIAKRGVLVLDQWFDPSLPSQVLARHYDSWKKTIDRRGGMVHHDTFSAAALAKPVLSRDDVHVSLGSWLHLATLDPAVVRAEAQAHLAKPGAIDADHGELAIILAAMDRIGMTDDGAVWMHALKR
jgi:SAM-dependent methyltransferase